MKKIKIILEVSDEDVQNVIAQSQEMISDFYGSEVKILSCEEDSVE